MMKSLCDRLLFAMMLGLGIGLLCFDAACSWAEICPNTKESSAACTSCQETYTDCAIEKEYVGEGGTFGTNYKIWCNGGGDHVNGNGPFSVTFGSGQRAISGNLEWCMDRAYCYLSPLTETPDSYSIRCILELSSSDAQTVSSESCGEI